MDHPSTPAETPPPTHPDVAAPAPKRRWRPSLKLIVILIVAAAAITGLIIGGKEGIAWLREVADQTRTPGMLAVLCVVYAVLLAIPGVPGLEVGLVMMGVFQEVGIIAAWLCTVAGLNLSFFAGRKLPKERVAAWLTPKNKDGTPIPNVTVDDDTMTLLLKRNRVGRAVLRWTGPPGGWRRYVLIAFLINMPGNFVIGGGGGIGLFCGTSADIKWPQYLVTTFVAAAVIPAMFYGGLLTVREVLPA